MNHYLQVVMLKYPTIYESVYEIVANSLAAKYAFIHKSDEFSEELAKKEVERIFVFNHNLGLSDAILIHSWFKDCCQFAVDTTSEILDNHKSKN